MAGVYRDAPLYRLTSSAKYLQQLGNIESFVCGSLDGLDDYHNFLCPQDGTSIDCTDDDYKILCNPRDCDNVANLSNRPKEPFDILDKYGRLVTSCTDAAAEKPHYFQQPTFIPNISEPTGSAYFLVQQPNPNVIYSCRGTDNGSDSQPYQNILCYGNGVVPSHEPDMIDCADNANLCAATSCSMLDWCDDGVDIYDKSGRFMLQCRPGCYGECVSVEGPTSAVPKRATSNYLIKQTHEFIHGHTPYFVCSSKDTNGTHSNILCLGENGFEEGRRIDCSDEAYKDLCAADYRDCSELPQNLCETEDVQIYDDDNIILSCTANCENSTDECHGYLGGKRSGYESIVLSVVTTVVLSLVC